MGGLAADGGLSWRQIIERAPAGVLVSGADGNLKYCNPAALSAVAPEGSAIEDLIGRPVRELLVPFAAAAAAPHPLPGGDVAWYLLLDSLRDLRDARYAAEVGDALAGNLNARRTLARIVDLAVPALGPWAAVTLWDPDRIRQVSKQERRRLPQADSGDDRTIPLSRLPDPDRKWLRGLIDSSIQVLRVDSPDELMTLGASAPAAAALLKDACRSVATAPLSAHGEAFGLLAVAAAVDGAVDLEGLEPLARRGAVALAAARVYEERSALAETLRSALVPPPLPTVEGIRVGAAYRPAAETTEIGGDFYEMNPDGSGWSFTLGDVCGKGVEAAVLTGQVRQSLRTVSLVQDDPVTRLEMLNSALLATNGSSFVTLVHGVMKVVDGGIRLRLAAGGHPAPLLRRPGGTVEEIAVGGPIVGILPAVSFRPAELLLAPGETLLVFTDGLTDANGPTGFLGADRLASVLSDSAGMTSQAISERCLQTALEHLDGRPHDDMAILAVQVGGHA